MTSWKSHGFKILIPVLFALLAIKLRQVLWYNFTDDILPVVKALVRMEHSFRPLPQRKPGPHVLVGFGGCVDLKVRAVVLLDALNWHPPNLTLDQLREYNHTEELNTEQDIILSFASSFISGAAVERVVQNGTVFDAIVRAASDLVPDSLRSKFMPSVPTDTFNSSILASFSLGGNAPTMAARLAREGAEVRLAARLSERQKANLPSNVKVLTAPPSLGLHTVPQEDIHLILEYEAGEKWGHLVSPRANRFIILRDEETSRLSGLWPGLLSSLLDPKPTFTGTDRDLPSSTLDLVVVGGLQVMDQWGLRDVPDVRSSRLRELGAFLGMLPPETLVHFEMASFVNQAFVTEMIRQVMPHVDSIGGNEQELPNLVSLLHRGTVTSISPAYPRIAHMLDTMRSVWALLNDPSLPRVQSAAGHGWRSLSRVHLHTVAYQAIMVRRHAQGGSRARSELEAAIRSGGLPVRRTDVGLAWPFTRAAVAKASLIAYRYTCGTSSVDPLKTRLLMDDSFAVTTDPKRWKSVASSSKRHVADNSANRTVPRIQFNASDPVTCWTEPEPDLSGWEEFQRTETTNRPVFDTVVEICVSPVLVCSAVRQTVGAGDNISAGALRAQLVSTRSVMS